MHDPNDFNPALLSDEEEDVSLEEAADAMNMGFLSADSPEDIDRWPSFDSIFGDRDSAQDSR